MKNIYALLVTLTSSTTRRASASTNAENIYKNQKFARRQQRLVLCLLLRQLISFNWLYHQLKRVPIGGLLRY